MSAADELREHFGDGYTPWSEGASMTLWEALPQIIAVVEAAEELIDWFETETSMEDVSARAVLDALTAKLEKR